tara:strand:+ start:411 stop:638 length:228 start_codon:yes stop_codon:yes gene_type:complete
MTKRRDKQIRVHRNLAEQIEREYNLMQKTLRQNGLERSRMSQIEFTKNLRIVSSPIVVYKDKKKSKRIKTHHPVF